MFCAHCGKQSDVGASYCSSCGASTAVPDAKRPAQRVGFALGCFIFVGVTLFITVIPLGILAILDVPGDTKTSAGSSKRPEPVPSDGPAVSTEPAAADLAAVEGFAIEGAAVYRRLINKYKYTGLYLLSIANYSDKL